MAYTKVLLTKKRATHAGRDQDNMTEEGESKWVGPGEGLLGDSHHTPCTRDPTQLNVYWSAQVRVTWMSS